MTNKLDSTRPGTQERVVTRKYYREFWPGIVGYVLVLTAAVIWGGLDGHSPWRFVWAMAPVIPMVWVVVAMFRHIRRIDDYQRFLLLQGLGVGFAVAMLTSITVGFLGIAGLGLIGAGWIIYSAGMIGWLVTSFVAHRLAKR